MYLPSEVYGYPAPTLAEICLNSKHFPAVFSSGGHLQISSISAYGFQSPVACAFFMFASQDNLHSSLSCAGLVSFCLSAMSTSPPDLFSLSLCGIPPFQPALCVPFAWDNVFIILTQFGRDARHHPVCVLAPLLPTFQHAFIVEECLCAVNTELWVEVLPIYPILRPHLSPPFSVVAFIFFGALWQARIPDADVLNCCGLQFAVWLTQIQLQNSGTLLSLIFCHSN